MDESYRAALQAIVASFRAGGQLLLCGNGGSGADCQHILGELVKGFLMKRPPDEGFTAAIGEDWAQKLQRGLPVIDLTANTALIGAVANDIDGLSAYAQQTLAYAKPGDVLLGISTSGNAENVRRAMLVAHALGATTIALTGEGGGKLKAICDIWLSVPETETYRVQELHLKLYHALCMDIERALFGG